jgi:hypothetical protein
MKFSLGMSVVVLLSNKTSRSYAGALLAASPEWGRKGEDLTIAAIDFSLLRRARGAAKRKAGPKPGLDDAACE